MTKLNELTTNDLNERFSMLCEAITGFNEQGAGTHTHINLLTKIGIELKARGLKETGNLTLHDKDTAELTEFSKHLISVVNERADSHKALLVNVLIELSQR